MTIIANHDAGRRTALVVALPLVVALTLAQSVTAGAVSSKSRASSSDAPALKAAATGTKANQFYKAVGWHTMWSEGNAHLLDQALAGRERHGLDRVDFLRDQSSSAGVATKDVARTEAALDYAAALAHGRVDPSSLHDVYTLPRPDPDLIAALAQALAKGTLATWLDDLAPQDAAYKQLSQAYLSERDKAASAAGDKIEAKGPIHLGDSDARVPAIVHQLVDNSYLSADGGTPPSPGSNASSARTDQQKASAEPTTYTQAYSDAIKDLQRDYGIAADGIVGPDTLEVLNLGPDDRARALAVALERRRWLSRTPPATRIDVNTAAAQLRYFRDGKLVDERKVIVGEPNKETPPLGAPIYRLVANPTWTVPKSIQNGELAHVGGDYLRDHNMVMRGGWIVQKSGPKNALGVVKFDMRDDQAIYLHDTSSRSLFDRSQRHLSHGCVRVEDAPGFAEQLATDEGVSDRWQKATAAHRQKFVSLPREIPVRLLYQNVFVGKAGEIVFRTDPYGWNDAVAQKLGFGNPPANRAAPDAIDLSP